MKSQEIRRKFLSFFEGKKHEIVASAPLVLKNDPTLMFVNAGMNQFKDMFLGNSPIKSPRLADTQKCLRVSGKHNDLEEVGHDTYHHTLFEMLGNWSFGDYFKKEAIHWAWELLTEVYGVEKDRLYVSVFEGDPTEDLAFDQEAYDLWRAIVPEERIIKGNKKDNFWEMGAMGPCGPCSEIHVDIRNADEREKVSGASLVNMDHPQVVEIWNLVFMQFNRMADKSLVALPQTHVDTGMGFERLAMVLQGKQSNYDTDVFSPLLSKIERLSGFTYGEKKENDIAMRVIADHVRAIAFATADGQLPSSNGAGYVIRRILRRAVRYGYTFLDMRAPFMYTLVEVLAEQMGDVFPEIRLQKSLVEEVIQEEERSFLRTLEKGLKRLQAITSSGEKVIDGKLAFELYDSSGFPIDLTQLIASENGMTVDMKGFERYLQEQKKRSQNAAVTETDDWIELCEDNKEEFIGYDYLSADVHIVKYRKVVEKKKSFYQLVFNITPFYAESGGQVGDIGYIEADGQATYIIDTKKENNLIIHITEELPKNVNSKFRATVEESARAKAAKNHTATHLLHEALRSVLGAHVEQKGSLVSRDYLRFDFSHFSKMDAEELIEVEKLVNQKIRENLSLVEQRTIPISIAQEEGAVALFGEKYGDLVRTIRFGDSIELCGGTHVKATSEIFIFKITNETAVQAGVRRIEAITADQAEAYFYEKLHQLDEIKSVLKNPKDAIKSIESLQSENADLKKQLEAMVRDKAKHVKVDLLNQVSQINGVNFISAKLDLDAGAIKALAFELDREIENLFLVLGSVNNGKAGLTISIAKDLAKEKGFNAGQMVRELGKEIAGGGGGQAHFATAGGKNPSGIDKALELSKNYLN